MAHKIDNQTFFSENKNPKWINPPIVVAWKFSSAENLGALLRVCDNFGITKAYFIGNAADYKTSKIKRNATTSFNKLSWKFISETDFWEQICDETIKIAVDTTSESVAINQFDFKTITKEYCLFFGNETIGLEDTVIKKCDYSIHIPMTGNSLSMNVVQAAAVTLYEGARQCLTATN